ncbi:MAG: ester cyclase [Chloroflexi bacterium]|nr:ester cyclase [Chloroflexota bacterium]
MSTEENKALIRRLNEEFWIKGNAGILDEVFAPDFLDHTALPGSVPGREGLKQSITMFRAAFSDISDSIDDLIAEGDKVVWRWTFHGTQTDTVMGVPATGKQITFTGITIDRIANGRIIERWTQADYMGFMQQLGVIPS